MKNLPVLKKDILVVFPTKCATPDQLVLDRHARDEIQGRSTNSVFSSPVPKIDLFHRAALFGPISRYDFTPRDPGDEIWPLEKAANLDLLRLRDRCQQQHPKLRSPYHNKPHR